MSPGAQPPTTARYALHGPTLPRIEDTVRAGEWLREAVVGRAGRDLGRDRVPPELSGHGLPASNRHGHAFYLPVDTDADGRIDHFLVHCPGGLAPASRRILGHLTRLWDRDGNEWDVVLEALGAPTMLAVGDPLCGSSSVWTSVTPYLRPWHAKRGFGYPEQVRRECAARGLPEPKEVGCLAEIASNGRSIHPALFLRTRTKRGLPQPDRRGTFLRLEFPTPVAGPLALGFGCHFGLGLLRPGA